MRKDKYENTGCGRRRIFGSKGVALVLAMVLLVGGVVGGTLAWLTAESSEVKNVFTTSDIGVTLEESKGTVGANNTKEFKMIPGWAIDKDPKVTVTSGSEDCYLFVKVEKSDNFDTYLAWKPATGWMPLTDTDKDDYADDGIYYRIVNTDDDKGKEFSILGAGSYTDNMGTTDKTDDDVTVTWNDNQVAVKPSVTKEMMTTAKNSQPTLNVIAYASQLYKSNNVQFTAAEAWNNVSKN